MKRVSNGFRLAVLVLFVTALFGAPLFSAPQKEEMNGRHKIKMALGDIESVEVLHLLVALERVKEKGIDVELISYKSEDIASQAVVNGQADIGIGTPYGLIQNVGAPIRLFYQLSMVDFHAVVNTKYYKDWKDLDGEEFVVHSRTSATLALAKLMEMKHGIKYKDFSYVPGSEVRAISMIQENIKATILDSYNTSFLLKKDPVRFKELNIGEIAASDEALFANLDYIKANSEVVQILIEELMATVKSINDNPASVLTLRKRYNLLQDLPADLEEEILPFFEGAAASGMFPEDGGGANAAKQDFALYGVAGEIKGKPEDLKVEDFWYLKPLNDALAKK